MPSLSFVFLILGWFPTHPLTSIFLVKEVHENFVMF